MQAVAKEHTPYRTASDVSREDSIRARLRICVVTLAFVTASAVFSAAPVASVASSAPQVDTPAATLSTADGVVVWSRNPTHERRVASTIKMLNALVVRDKVDLDEVVVVSPKAEAIDNGEVGLVAGQKLTVRQLLEIMLVTSANDAAEALAIHVAGSEQKFVKMMNAKAHDLGLKNTKAADPHGLSKRERSSAADLAVIGRHVLEDKELRRIVAKRSAKIPLKRGRSWHKRSTDRLLGSYPGIEGMKTGYTDPAGYCFVGAAKRGDVELVGVVLGAGSSEERWASMRRLLDWGFAHVSPRELVSCATTVSVEATGGDTPTGVIAHPEKTVTMALMRGGPKVSTRVKTDQPVVLPVAAGQRVGTLELVRKDSVLAEVPLLAVTDVPLPATESVEMTPPVAPAQQRTEAGVLNRLYAAVMGFWRRLSGA